MTQIAKSIQAIKEYLADIDDDELIGLHNTYCQENNYPDDEIYSNGEDFFDAFFEDNVIKAVRAVSYGYYNYTDKWVKFNGYGNLDSFNNPDGAIDYREIAEDILENPDQYEIELVDEDED